MHWLLIIVGLFAYATASPITYEDVRGTPYKVGYDHRAITINGVRTMLISGAIHYENGQKSRPEYRSNLCILEYA